MAMSYPSCLASRVRRAGRCCWLALLLCGCGRDTSAPTIEQATAEPALHAGYDALNLRRSHLENLGVARWHALGWEGQGVKVAVLDSGFRDYREFLGAGLPRRVLARSFRKDRNLEARASQHGILCAETI